MSDEKLEIMVVHKITKFVVKIRHPVSFNIKWSMLLSMSASI